jgi:hypothetical protein
VHDVAGGPTSEGTVAERALVELGERAFDQAGRHADQGDCPHPEDGTGSAEGNRHRHASDVAAADPAADRDEERLAGRHGVGIGALVARAQHAEHAHEELELDETRHERDEHAEDHQDRDQRPAPREILDQAEEAGDPLHGRSPTMLERWAPSFSVAAVRSTGAIDRRSMTRR